MKSITERPPILTVHEDSGDYILRLGDLKYRGLVAAVSKLLPDARRLIVVTPGDVKFFVVGGSDDEGNNSSSGSTSVADAVGDGGGEEVQEQEVTSQLPQPEEPDVESEAEPRPKLTRRRKPLNETVKVGHPEKCQRCAGSGVTRTLMPDNSTAESMCPICQGEGSIKRYGARR